MYEQVESAGELIFHEELGTVYFRGREAGGIACSCYRNSDVRPAEPASKFRACTEKEAALRRAQEKERAEEERAEKKRAEDDRRIELARKTRKRMRRDELQRAGLRRGPPQKKKYPATVGQFISHSYI